MKRIDRFLHRHRVAPSKTKTYGWQSCVVPGLPHSERPHGNVVEIYRCRCGATKSAEINGGTKLAGEWTP